MRALLLLALATPAAAQVAPEDAWAAIEAWWEAWGLALDATLAREGEALGATDVLASADLPLGLGTLSLELPDLLLTDRGDGTVVVEVPEPAAFRADLRLFLGEDAIALALPGRIAWIGREAVAAGTPGDVTFSLRARRVDVSLDGAAMDRGPGTPRTDLEFDASWEGLAAETRVTVAEGQVAVATTGGWDAALYGYAAREEGGGTSEGAGRGGATTLGASWALPAGASPRWACRRRCATARGSTGRASPPTRSRSRSPRTRSSGR